VRIIDLFLKSGLGTRKAKARRAAARWPASARVARYFWSPLCV